MKNVNAMALLYKNSEKTRIKEILMLGGIFLGSLYFVRKDNKMYSWIYRDDIGAPDGIHGYEEQVNSVGGRHGHYHWTQEKFFTTFDSATVRRGFKVWLKSCQSCHGAWKQKYDVMVDKVFSQQELIEKMKDTPPVHPGHQVRRAHYFQEWDYRQRVIHDHIWSTYMTRDHAKSANGGLWPVDLSRTAEHNPAHAGFIYNILTGYHYKPPFGHEVPEGRYFNPYHHHMIIGMARQLHDGMMKYEDGTPASTPQMAHDVSTFIDFLENKMWPDIRLEAYMTIAGLAIWLGVSWFYIRYYEFNLFSSRYEVYALRDGSGYMKFREKMFRHNKNQYLYRGLYS